MPFSAPAFLLHLTSVTLMLKGYGHASAIIPELEWTSKCGQWQFLTIQSIIASIITMALGLFVDLTSSRTGKRIQLRLLAIAMPTSWAVTLIYWSLIFFSPNLIYPSPEVQFDPSLDADATTERLENALRLPLMHDLLLHAVPALCLSLEFLFFQQPYSGHALVSGVLLAHAITGAYYGSFVEYCASFDGRFPYPFLEKAPLFNRILIYTAGTLLTTFSLWFINQFHPSASRKDESRLVRGDVCKAVDVDG